MENYSTQLYNEGLCYYRVIAKTDFNKPRLGNEMVYNMICLSAEAMLTGFLMTKGEIPEHGNVVTMIKTCAKYNMAFNDLIPGARLLNRFHTWCSLDFVPSKTIYSEDLSKMFLFLSQLIDVLNYSEEVCLCHNV